MKRLLVVTMAAGLMSFGAIAGQSAKHATKSSTPPVAASSASSTTATSPEHPKHVKKSKKKHAKEADGSVKPKN
ncbi:MAG: hypothetical protein IT170_13715 [Bryobacterales bacterium]|nr:hypothetical protein [Bryobacterales bacterium]